MKCYLFLAVLTSPTTSYDDCSLKKTYRTNENAVVVVVSILIMMFPTYAECTHSCTYPAPKSRHEDLNS